MRKMLMSLALVSCFGMALGGTALAAKAEGAGDKKAVGPVTVEQAVAEITKDSIHFDFDLSAIKPEAKKKLQRKAELLKQFPDLKMTIEGHCDERGTNEYNLALGDRRAKAAQDFLVSLGIDASRLSIVSFGEEHPVSPNHNESAWTKNRRDEFKITIVSARSSASETDVAVQPTPAPAKPSQWNPDFGREGGEGGNQGGGNQGGGNQGGGNQGGGNQGGGSGIN